MEALYLRALDTGDVERTLRWHNDQELYHTIPSPFRYVSRAAEEEWIRKVSVSFPHQVNLAICLAKSHQHIGNVYFRDIDWVARHAFLGIFIGEAAERFKGHGINALALAFRHMFRDLGLHRIWAVILDDNDPSIQIGLSCGMKREGVLRQHAFKNGQFKDLVILGVMNDELNWKLVDRLCARNERGAKAKS